MNPEFTNEFIIETKTSLTNHESRLTTLEETVKDIKDLTLSVREIALNQKTMNDKIDENQKSMNDKIDGLSVQVKEVTDAPRKNWITIRTAILSSVGGAIGTGIIALLISFMK